MKRIFDLFVVILLIPFFLFLLLIISTLIKFDSAGPIIFWSDRVGKNNKLFQMPKFRTMHTNAPLIETNKLSNNERYITRLGYFLRKTSLDELPQIWSVLKGDMSIVGPRPALFNQHDLISSRTSNNVYLLRPGITGWAQINGRDFISIEEKSNLDKFYLQKRSFLFDIYIIFLTLVKLLKRSDIKH